MGFLKKIFGDDEEQQREEAARREAAERYAEEHAHGKEAEHETPAAKKAAAKKTAASIEPKAAAKKTTEKPAKAAPEKLAATKSAAAKAATAKPADAKAAAPAPKKTADKAPAPAAKAAAPAPAHHDPIPAQRTYAPLSGAPAADAHTHVHDVAEGPVTVAHDQMMTVHIETHVPDHQPREDDPHYHLFEQAKARLKRQGLWKCIIGDELCGGEPELHHTYIEFSQINEVDPKKLQEALGLHFDNDEDFQKWAESPGNLEVLCANHHRTHYGIHVIPGPLWEALRFRMVGTEAAAEFVTADEAKDEATKEAAAS
jgi:chemotaxis protein histidine kinase CheA